MNCVQNYGRKLLPNSCKQNCDPVTDIYHVANGNVKWRYSIGPFPSSPGANEFPNFVQGLPTLYFLYTLFVEHGE